MKNILSFAFFTLSVCCLAAQSAGELTWAKHLDDVNGTQQWKGGWDHVVGTGWQDYKSVFATSNATIYGIKPNGDLTWAKHKGNYDGTSNWEGGWDKAIGKGWQDYKMVFAAPGGIIYGIKPNGDLTWAKHEGYGEGNKQWKGGWEHVVGTGWQDYKMVFATANGVIYGIKPNGDLTWAKHLGQEDGTARWEGGWDKVVGTGWQEYKTVFATKPGIIYGLKPNGDLTWAKHNDFLTGGTSWKGGWNHVVGTGWGQYKILFGSNGAIYGIKGSGKNAASNQGISISLPDLVHPICPNALLKGDREFDGHGPLIKCDASLFVADDDRALYVEINLWAQETQHDWSTTEIRWIEKIYEAPSGKSIKAIYSDKYSKTQFISPPGGFQFLVPGNDVARTINDFFAGAGGSITDAVLSYYNIPPGEVKKYANLVTGYMDNGNQVVRVPTQDGALVRYFHIVGDTGGPDISDDTNCNDDLRIVKIEFFPVRIALK